MQKFQDIAFFNASATSCRFLVKLVETAFAEKFNIDRGGSEGVKPIWAGTRAQARIGWHGAAASELGA